MPDDAERPEGSELERYQRKPAHPRMNIVREGACLTQRKLCRRRAGLAGLGVSDGSTIADRPEAWTSRGGKRFVDQNGTTLVSFDRKGLDKRIWCCAGGPHYRLGVDFFRVTEEDGARARIGDADVELEADPACGHALQRVGGELLAELR